MKTIIVIDDDTATLLVVSLVLRNEGFKVMTFASVENVLKTVIEVRPKLVLADVQIGEHDGRLLCKDIKNIKEVSDIPVILFSATVRYGTNLQKYLCDDFIEKPFDIDHFIEKIRKYAD